MRIYDRDPIGAAAAETGRAQDTQKTDRETNARPQAATDGSADRVELSSTLSRVARALSTFGSDRAAKVQSLSNQYQSGSYWPDAMATSKGMIAEALGVGAN
ncbi:MAG TPA: flagellar biosynthesis anti-sigma factor FlgM [Bryobacteraceae bacterium]|nr:flagellar biosynthesis anti-sigma factor FlgM [Bryobacteraceae bacterium]